MARHICNGWPQQFLSCHVFRNIPLSIYPFYSLIFKNNTNSIITPSKFISNEKKISSPSLNHHGLQVVGTNLPLIMVWQQNRRTRPAPWKLPSPAALDQHCCKIVPQKVLLPRAS